MRKNTFQNLFIGLFILLGYGSSAQNIFGGEPVQLVGAFNGYSTTPYNSDYRTLSYRRLSTPSGNPTDGRGQWSTTINVKNTGGDIAPVTLTGGAGNGFLFISGPSSNRFQNKWTFTNVGSATLGNINNITAYNSGEDMGINLTNEGYYTFNFNDAGYTTGNSKFLVAYTANPPISVSRTSESFSAGQKIISITSSAAPSPNENVYVRYRNVNDFATTGSSVVQAVGSGTTWTATIPQQACGSTIYYYVFTSTRTLTNLIVFSEPSYRTLSAIRFDDNGGLNYAYTVNPSTSAVLSGSTAICPGDTTDLKVTVTGGTAPYTLVLTDGTSTFTVPNYASDTAIPVSPSTNTNYAIVSVTSSNGCVGTGNSGIAEITILGNSIFYRDTDQDGFGDSTTTLSACSLPTGYVTNSLDCDDTLNTVYPGASEVCWNGILENCSSTLSAGCAPVVVTMNPSYHNTTLASLATAIPALPYVYGGFTNLKYRFSITNITTGVKASDIIQTSRFVTIPAVIHSHGASYTIKVSAVINDEIVPFSGNTITVNSPSIPLISLATSSCGSTLSSLASTLTANPGLNAIGYTFRIRLNDSNPSPTYYTSNSATRFVGANTFTGFPLQYGMSYKVSVQYTFINPVSGFPVDSGYGSECTINTPMIPATSMASPTCGATVSTLNASITARAASYATGYKFRIRLFSDNGPAPTYYLTPVQSSRFSSLTAFQGITMAYSTEYAISVQYSLFNGFTTEWSNFGPECKVTTPAFPTTSLVPSQCGLLTPTSLTQQLNITPYPGFPNYKVLLEEIDGETVVTSEERELVYSHFKLSDFAIAALGKNYNVSVAIKLNGVYGDYSTACDLFTEEAAQSKAMVQTPFTATAYPNPFANNFRLDVKTTIQSAVNVKVYDIIGRLIEQRDINLSDMESTTIGNQYPSGVYHLVVSQEDGVETVRVIKR